MKLPARRENWIRREIKGGMESEAPHFELLDYISASVLAPAKYILQLEFKRIVKPLL